VYSKCSTLLTPRSCSKPARYASDNQLTPCSFSFSPRPPRHPRTFQHTWVRASSQCSLTFTLDMGSSHGFGSTTAYSSAYLDSLSLRLRVFHLTLHTIVTRRSMLQKVRRNAKIALRLLVGTRFQVLFHSPAGVLFTFPSRYWFTIGH